MDRLVVSCGYRKTYRLDRRHALWLSTVLLCCSLTAPAQKTIQQGDTSAPFSTRATHLLGFANARNNGTGILSVSGQFIAISAKWEAWRASKDRLCSGCFSGRRKQANRWFYR